MVHLPLISGDEFVKAAQKAGYVWDHTEGITGEEVVGLCSGLFLGGWLLMDRAGNFV